jgi:hypothetical protein
MRLPFAGLLLLAALSTPRTAPAQSIDPRLAVPRLEPGRIGFGTASRNSSSPLMSDDAAARGAALEWLAAGGVVGGALGMAGGLLVGALVDGPPEEDCIVYCVSPGMAIGALVGEALGIAAGVHLANGRHGSLFLDTAASSGILALGLVGGLESPGVVVLIPVAQIVGAMAVERSTQR